jgi:hypothetical protein
MSAQSDFITSAIKSAKSGPIYHHVSESARESYAYTFDTAYGPMTFIPESFVNKGVNGSDGRTYWNSYFQNQNNLNKFALDSTYVDMSGAGSSAWNTRGYVIPSRGPGIGLNTQWSQDTKWLGGGLTGLGKDANGNIVYATTSSYGRPGGFISPPGFNGDLSAASDPNAAPLVHNPYDIQIGGGILPGPIEKVLDGVLNNLGSIVKLAAIVTENPALYLAAAGGDLANGNYLSAAVNIAGMYGQLPGVDADTASTVKNIYNGLQIANAIKTNNPIAALTALSGMTGTGLPSEFMKATQLIAVNNAIQKKDLAALAVAVGNIADNKDLSYAGKAVKVAEAIKTGDVSKITASLYGFIPELQAGYKAGDVSAIFDKMGYSLGPTETKLLEDGLNTPPEKLAAAAVGSTDEGTAKLLGEIDAGVFPDMETARQYNFIPEAYEAAKAQQAANDAIQARLDAEQKAESDASLAKYLKSLETPAQPTEQTTTQPTEPTKAPERPLQNVFDAYVRAYGLDQGAGLFQQMYGDVRPYLQALQADNTAAPADDGTTAGIEDIINVVNPPADTGGSLGNESDLPPVDEGGSLGNESDLPPVDQGGSLGDESDLPPTDQGGSLGDESDLPPATEEEPQCAPGYHWDGSMCVSDEDVTDTSTTCPEGYIFDLGSQSCVPVGATTGGAGGAGGGTKPGGTTPKTPTTPTTPTTPKTPTTPTIPSTGAQTGSQQMDMQSLLALLSLTGGGQQAAPTPPPTVDIGPQLDLEAPLEVNPFARTQTQPKMATGGSIDDLLAMLQQRG